MIDTFWISMRLRIAYRVNTILYSLKQLPLIKRLLPISLYASKGLKRFALISSIIWEFLSMFLNNGLYLFICVFLPMQYFALSYDAFAHIYLFLTIAGAVCNCRVFDPRKDTYYAIILMRMNARSYSVTQHLYSIARVFVGTQAFLLFLIIRWQAPVWLGLLPFGVAGAKTISVAVSLYHYEQKGIVRNENSPVKWVWGTIAICFFLAYGAIIPKLFLPAFCIMTAASCSFVFGLFVFPYLWKFAHYRSLAQQLFQQKNTAVHVSLNTVTNENYQNKISDDHLITSNKHGYAYFNELFIKRHQRLLWRYAKRISLITLLVWLVLFLALLYFPQAKAEGRDVLLVYLPYLIFLVYSFHSGKSVVQAMFRNCDHSMLTYSFYRRKETILSLFRLRLFAVIRINLLPALILGTGYAGILLVCDPTLAWTSLVVIISVLASSVLFSIHYLTCYYLLQPYNAATETKSATYGMVMGITYILCFAFIYLRVDAFLFGILMIVFSSLYAVIAYYLIGKHASKTFRLRH